MSGDLGPLESRTCHIHISKDSNHNNLLSVVPSISYSSPLSASKGETQQGYLTSPGPPDSLSLHSLSLPGEGFLLSLRSLIHSLTVSHRRQLQSLLLHYYFYIALLTAHSMSHGGRPGPENAESSGGSLHFTSESGITRTLGSTEPLRDESNSQDPSNVQTGQGTFTPSEDGRICVLKALEEVMESFRGGKTLKTEAISSVLHVIREDSDVSAIVLPDGVENHSDKIPGKKPSKSNSGGDKPEICNKFNAGTCKNSDADCKYQHLCKGCHKPGHGKNDCLHERK